MRKLLWTFGSDPEFESYENKNAIMISPSNFHRVCDRFGLACTRTQAHEIFSSHGLPAEGCNMYTLAKRFNDAGRIDGGIGKRKEERLDPSARPTRTLGGGAADPFKLARLADDAWKAHRTGNLPPLPRRHDRARTRLHCCVARKAPRGGSN